MIRDNEVEVEFPFHWPFSHFLYKNTLVNFFALLGTMDGDKN